MKKMLMLPLAVSVLGTGLVLPNYAKAESEAECAIWLCLPGGFPEGCEAAHSAFNDRVKRGDSPLPPLANCTTGNSKGDYEIGYERLEDCKAGYLPRQNYYVDGVYYTNACVAKDCTSTTGYQMGKTSCDHYERHARQQPNFIKMWVDGDYLGQFWW
jgi:hypothetical protein